ncbi:MAG: hypothetical protein A2008_09470 [Candidatus Wallbacteria bacterium GWC2_49_35]|uniref:Uncharacterized protein n=1 Tax=Candidatus Wallbacteria bacterium GWC2_49_35 TaxID=1817813 RepID=A0A1F7WKL9_9BACT|nr:MAG: hypothetical protein A2008_09470 [Candidatus Wallbacteria bacterium GWC2_49_35]
MNANYIEKIKSLKRSGEFTEKLVNFIGAVDAIMKEDDFRCLVLYGNILNDGFREGVSTAELLIIPSEAGIGLLEKLHVPLQTAAAELKMVPLIMTFEEILLSADVFPVKFLEIKNNYIVLAGEDLLADLVIPDENIRLHCEQELRNFSLKLRNDFITMFPDEFNMYNALIKYIPELLSTIRLFIEYKSGRKLSKISEVMLYLKEQFGVSYDSINDIINLKKSNTVLTCEEIKEIYSKLNILINELTRKADAQ